MTTNEIYAQRNAARLECKVKARNEANHIANQLGPMLIEALKPLVGQKILNQGGMLSAKAKAILEKASGSLRDSFYFHSNNTYSLYVTVKTSASNADGCSYAEQSIRLGDIDAHSFNLAKLADPVTDWRDDWTVEEVREIRAELRKAQDATNACKSRLGDFGEHDSF